MYSRHCGGPETDSHWFGCLEMCHGNNLQTQSVINIHFTGRKTIALPLLRLLTGDLKSRKKCTANGPPPLCEMEMI